MRSIFLIALFVLAFFADLASAAGPIRTRIQERRAVRAGGCGTAVSSSTVCVRSVVAAPVVRSGCGPAGCPVASPPAAVPPVKK
jgi:hypothetical protein